MDFEELLRKAKAALAAGHSEAEVDAAIQKASGGQYAGIRELAKLQQAQLADQAATAGQETAQIQRVADRSAVSNFLRAMGQGASFGFADELTGLMAGMIPGGMNREEATAASRQRMEDLRTVAPGATLMGEIAGAAIVPVGLLGQAVRGRILAPTVMGAVGGGAFGAGESEGGVLERLPATAVGAGLGAAGGAFLGGIFAGLPALSRIIKLKLEPGRAGEELSKRLIQRVGQGETTLTALIEKSKGRLSEISNTLFKPLEKQYRAVDDPLVQRVLRRLLDDERTSSVVRRALPGKVQAYVRGAEGRAPSFTELQKVRRALGNEITRSKPTKTYPGDPNRMEVFSEAQDLFTGAVDRKIPAFAEARSQYGRVIAADKAIDQAHKLRNAPVDVIEDALRKLPTDEARENFRARLVIDLYDKLSRKGDIGRGEVDKLLALGERGRLRQLFTSEKAFNDFLSDLQASRRAAVAKEALVPITMRLMQGLGFGGGGYVGYRIARGLID